MFADRLHRQRPSGFWIPELGCRTGQMSIRPSLVNREVLGLDMSCGSLRMGREFVTPSR